jgi:hypothetical protein
MIVCDPTSAAWREPLAEAVQQLTEVDCPAAPSDASAEDTSPALLPQAFAALLDAMQRTQVSVEPPDAAAGSGAAGTSRTTELGEYAVELFDRALTSAHRFAMADVEQTLQLYLVSVASWIARRSGQILSLEPVVDALAQLANRTREPAELVAVYDAMTEISNAVAPALRQDLENTSPGRPWRILHLNRAIVATRTHRADIMEEAFAALVQNLPDDAPGFFSQGMEQMELLNYPSHVRDVMHRYYRQWSARRSLH